MKGLLKKKRASNDVVRRRLSDDSLRSRSSGDTSSRTFERNRTVASKAHGMSPLDASTSSRQHVHALKTHRQKIGGVLIALVVASLVVGYVLFTLVVYVRIATPSNATITNAQRQQYETAINKYYDLHPLERFRPLLNEAALVRHLSETDAADIRSIERVAPTGVATSTFSIVFRKPIAVFIVNGDEKFVDDEGVVFSRSYFDTPSIRIRDENGEQAAASSRLVEFIGKIVGALQAQGVTVKDAIMPATAIRYVDLITDKNERIRVGVDRSEFLQAEDAQRAIAYLREQGKKTQYIDVRVSGRVFYRLK